MPKVLVTGADGFIGSSLVEFLFNQGLDVRAMSQYNSFNSWGWLENLSCLSKIEIINGDVRDPNFCRKAVEGIDAVFHLAALIAIPYSYIAPDSYVQTNVTGTLNMIQASMDAGVSKFIHTSTSEVYGTAKFVPINEDHPLQPQSPYSASKIGADSMAMSFYNAFDYSVTIARPFNTYGPRQSARAIIPTIITQIAAGMKAIKVGDLSPTRDFNFVEDTCLGFYKLFQAGNVSGQTVNIGSNTEISIGDTLELIKKLMNSSVQFEVDSNRIRPKNSEVHRLVCDNSKIKKLIGYEPQFNLEAGLRKTIDWFIKPQNLVKYKPDIYNV